MKIKIISNISKIVIILLGSESGQKKEILRDVLENLIGGDFEVVSHRVESGITEQPLSTEVTRQGAINRAARAAETFDDVYDFSFGLEAGLELVGGLYHFVSVAAILQPEGRYSVGTSRLIPLPRTASDRATQGEYLSDIIREYRHQEGLSEAEKEAVEDLIYRRRGFMEAILKAWEKGDRDNNVVFDLNG